MVCVIYSHAICGCVLVVCADVLSWSVWCVLVVCVGMFPGSVLVSVHMFGMGQATVKVSQCLAVYGQRGMLEISLSASRRDGSRE